MTRATLASFLRLASWDAYRDTGVSVLPRPSPSSQSLLPLRSSAGTIALEAGSGRADDVALQCLRRCNDVLMSGMIGTAFGVIEHGLCCRDAVRWCTERAVAGVKEVRFYSEIIHEVRLAHELVKVATAAIGVSLEWSILQR